MTTQAQEMQVTQVNVDAIQQLEAQEKASYDIQIATAKKYPRDIRRAMENSIVIATMNAETARSCGYALPRGGKPITGPSVHLARIIAQNWGNLRVESRVAEITANQIVSQAVCFDLESNYAVKVEVRKKITDRYGKRYNDDMITVTGNAANSIAYRNAVFAVIPKSISDKVYTEAQGVITGDISDSTKLIQTRDKWFKHFKTQYAATEEEVLKAVGVATKEAIAGKQITLMVGIEQAIKDGDTTAAQAFGRVKPAKNQAAEVDPNKVTA